MNKLNSADYINLRNFVASDNRVGYWSYLATKGDDYAALALGVATNETREGYIANSFFLARAQSAGLGFSEAQLHQVGLQLMARDLAAREDRADTLDGGLTLPVNDIAAYHGVVFQQASQNLLDVRAWTAELPLRAALAFGAQTGDYSQAETIFRSMKSPNFWTQANKPLGSIPGLESGTVAGIERAAWITTVGFAMASYVAVGFYIDPSAEFSYRNIARVNGWTADGDGNWYRDLPGVNVDIANGSGNPGLSIVVRNFADAQTAAQLEQIKAERISRYGESTVRLSEGLNEYILENGNVKKVASHANGSFDVILSDGGEDENFATANFGIGINGKYNEIILMKDNGYVSERYFDYTGVSGVSLLKIESDKSHNTISTETIFSNDFGLGGTLFVKIDPKISISADNDGDDRIDVNTYITFNLDGTHSSTNQVLTNGVVTGSTTATVNPASSLIDNSFLTTISVVELSGVPRELQNVIREPTGEVANGLVISGGGVTVAVPTINEDGLFFNAPGGIVTGHWRPGAQELSESASNQYELITPTTGLAIFAGLDGGGFYVNAPAADYAAGGIGSYLNIDPLVLDLDGDGIELSNWVRNAVYFETNVTRASPTAPWVSDGMRHHTGWVDGDDAILVFRPTPTTVIKDITQTLSEFFRGGTYANGFKAARNESLWA